MSMRVMSAGAGYKYLLRTTVAVDAQRSLLDSLTRYYAGKGTPPGFWLGSAVSGLADGELAVGSPVSEAQLELLLGSGCNPVTGAPLGRAWADFASVDERVARRMDKMPLAITLAERAEMIGQIEAEERTKPVRTPVAGFDHTFSVPKSVSALWAVADGGTQALIAQAHHAAIEEVLDLFERDVAMTRVGADAGDGSVGQVEVRGVVATAYDHYDSRSHDPQLHTHVVITNKVQGAHDGKWRTLDGRPIHRAVVALSEHYNAVLADHLARDLGLGWEWRDRGERRNPAFELTGVPQRLVEAFSTRSRDIEEETDRLVEAYGAKHGRAPGKRAILRLRAEATLRTRPEKSVLSLAELTASWREQATAVLGRDATAWASDALDGGERIPLVRADDLRLDAIADLGRAVVQIVGEKRSTWQRWNLYAEAARQLMDVRFASTADREAAMGLLVDAAEQASVRLTPPEIAYTPVFFQREDGSSVFRPKHGAVFSSAELLEAETRLLVLADTQDASTLDLARVDRGVRRRTSSGHRLTPDQAAAITRVSVSGRAVDVLVGPAGTGKTTTLSVLRRIWEAQHGKGAVVGLAPSDAAAAVLAQDLRITTDNTAKWLYEHDQGRWTFEAGQLIIVDEASLAGTFTLDRITGHARDVGAKVLLVGDYAQLDAVDSGGAFALIARTLGADAAELSDVRRFNHDWERRASLRLRLGMPDAVQEYQKHDRVTAGDYEDMLDAAYQAWLADTKTKKTSLMIAETVEAVTELNLRARLDRITAGTIDPAHAVRLHDGTEAAAGDVVATRHNDRRLRVGKTWVKNGDLWDVLTAHDDGSLTVTRKGHWGGAIRLPAKYVKENVELGYAVTSHRAQGSTVDTGHVVVPSSQMTREAFYVAMTRGRQANRAYVATDQPGLEEHQLRPDEGVTAQTVLEGVLHHVGAEPSAHESIRTEQEAVGSIAQLAAEYDTIAQTAQADRWVRLLETSGLTGDQVDAIVDSDSFGPLAAELRRADANRHRPETFVPTLIAERPIQDADDIGAILRARIQKATTAATGSTRQKAPRLVVGLIPRALGVADSDLQRGLDERAQLIENRAFALAEAAVTAKEPWTKQAGVPPAGRARRAWIGCLATVAAYRDRYGITDPEVSVGAPSQSSLQRIDAARARAALERARALAAPTKATSPAPRRPARTL
ncbi:MobF family relaxase [Microbacterium sp. NPDC056234]|uniref:MobF family relaxase n=1 Tax=Microbacterium sp. NPDC056234 TaxID=3345757 RepID=UPI0035DA5C0F